jgi:hypothetical protein
MALVTATLWRATAPEGRAMGLEGFIGLMLRLAAGILAIQDPGQPVSADQALAWAAAVAYHAENKHLDPYEIIGIARNESDFRVDLIGPDGKDCGITQTRVTFSKYRCARLRRDATIGFEEAARELSENQARCAKYNKGDIARCRLNSYNSGIRYAKSGWNGSYWLRVSCFAEAARRGLRPVTDCRKVQDRGDIARVLKASEAAVEAMALKMAPKDRDLAPATL